MCAVWAVAPSKRPEAEVREWAAAWRKMGYLVGVFRDTGEELAERFNRCPDAPVDKCLSGPYEGHAVATNNIVRLVLMEDPACDWVAAVADDIWPDMSKTADEIARDCSEYFRKGDELTFPEYGHTFGVMQPTGDRFADGSIDRIAGSPWLGREFCRRINQGRGPLWPEYFHMFDDEELWHVAQKYGVYWMRRDLVHLHRWWGRDTDALDSQAGRAKPAPEFLARANSQANWDAMKRIFEHRKAHGFPGSEPIP